MLKKNRSKQQHGLSLIELMIALLLGTLIVIGASNLFIASSAMFATQQGLLEVQQEGAFTQQFIRRHLRHIGYKTPKHLDTRYDHIVLSGSESDIKSSCSKCTGLDKSSDRITFKYEFQGTEDYPLEDCVGNEIKEVAIVTQSIWLTDNDELKCLSDGEITDSSGERKIKEVVVAEGVSRFKVSYGIDNSEEAFVTASQYKYLPNSDDTVVAVKTAFIVERKAGNQSRLGKGAEFLLLDEIVTTQAIIEDRQEHAIDDSQRIRKAFSMVTPIRNLNWISFY